MYVIGTVGPFGSGCTYIANLIKKSYKNYSIISLSDILRECYKNENGEEKPQRKVLQLYGDKIRKEKGADFLAKKAIEQIKKDRSKNYIIDSIRNPAESNYLSKHIINFYLVGIFAEEAIRWNRVKAKYNDNHGEFSIDDEKDRGKGEKDFGQQVTDTFRIADIVIQNNRNVNEGNEDYKLLVKKIKNYIDIINRTIPFRPTVYETCMTAAYAVSMRSSCLKRKVGAVIVDEMGNIVSSGYNEVPASQRSCNNEYAMCYRDKLKQEFKRSLQLEVSNDVERDNVYNSFKQFKILDYCRALHAEENAILNIARIGASNVLTKSSLYTTTYPCNLCANKIAQVGIREVVYFEPYPMPEAKRILSDKHVRQTPFEGVTYNGYFRLMEVVK